MQTCDVRDECAKVMAAKMHRPFTRTIVVKGKKQPRPCGYEGAGTVMFCPTRRRLLDAAIIVEEADEPTYSPSLTRKTGMMS